MLGTVQKTKNRIRGLDTFDNNNTYGLTGVDNNNSEFDNSITKSINNIDSRNYLRTGRVLLGENGSTLFSANGFNSEEKNFITLASDEASYDKRGVLAKLEESHKLDLVGSQIKGPDELKNFTELSAQNNCEADFLKTENSAIVDDKVFYHQKNIQDSPSMKVQLYNKEKLKCSENQSEKAQPKLNSKSDSSTKISARKQLKNYRSADENQMKVVLLFLKNRNF